MVGATGNSTTRDLSLERMVVFLLYAGLSFLCIITVLARIAAPISYDLIFYEQYFSLFINTLEPGFKFLFHSLSRIGVPFKLALYVLPAIWAGLILVKRRKGTSRVAISVFLLLMFGSQFFTLGILNALRQFYASLFILLCLMEVHIKISKREVFLFYIVSASLHWSSIVMFPFVYYFFWLAKGKRFFYITAVVISASAFLSVFFFNELFLRAKYLTEFQEGRTSTLLKLVVIGIYYLFTASLARNRPDIQIYTKIRFALFAILLAFAAFGELFSRFLYFFSCYEVLYFFLFVSMRKGQYLPKMLYVCLFMFYNFLSLNVINVLWKQLIQD